MGPVPKSTILELANLCYKVSCASEAFLTLQSCNFWVLLPCLCNVPIRFKCFFEEHEKCNGVCMIIEVMLLNS